MEVLQVQEYNRQAYKRYDEAVDRYEPTKGGFPFLPMYLFLLENGEKRQRGWVASKKGRHYFNLNREKAIEELES